MILFLLSWHPRPSTGLRTGSRSRDFFSFSLLNIHNCAYIITHILLDIHYVHTGACAAGLFEAGHNSVGHQHRGAPTAAGRLDFSVFEPIGTTLCLLPFRHPRLWRRLYVLGVFFSLFSFFSFFAPTRTSVQGSDQPQTLSLNPKPKPT